MTLHLLLNIESKELIEVTSQELDIIMNPVKCRDLIKGNTSYMGVNIGIEGVSTYVFHLLNVSIDVFSMLNSLWVEVPNTKASRILYGQNL